MWRSRDGRVVKYVDEAMCVVEVVGGGGVVGMTSRRSQCFDLLRSRPSAGCVRFASFTP